MYTLLTYCSHNVDRLILFSKKEKNEVPVIIRVIFWNSQTLMRSILVFFLSLIQNQLETSPIIIENGLVQAWKLFEQIWPFWTNNFHHRCLTGIFVFPVYILSLLSSSDVHYAGHSSSTNDQFHTNYLLATSSQRSWQHDNKTIAHSTYII